MKRKEYIDWLRNLGILLLFPFHTARIFNDNPEFYVKGVEHTPSTVFIGMTSFWFMLLLFLLAGMSSRYALLKRPARHYLKERHRRLLIPFVFGCLVVVPPQAYYAMKFHEGYRGGYPEFLRSYFTDFSEWTVLTGISPAHLWFILFLFVISLALLPLMLGVLRRGQRPVRPGRPFLVLLVPAVVMALLSLLPEAGGENIFVYAGYVFLGFLLAGNDATLAAIQRARAGYLALAVPGAVAVVVQRSLTDGPQDAVFTAWQQPVCVAALLALLGYGQRYLDRPSSFMRWFSPAAFPVYILHQTFLIVIAYYALRESDRIAVAFPVIMIGSFVLSVLSYEIIRRTWGLRTLFGLSAAAARPVPGATGETAPVGR
ncbi:acyltransferase family protein [Streptomyces xiamenensis]